MDQSWHTPFDLERIPRAAGDGGSTAMKTSLRWLDFLASARALDQKRLGKQRVEAIQVLRRG